MGHYRESSFIADKSDEKVDPDRHCAYCLQRGSCLLCSGCGKRAYCSVSCRRKDWFTESNGQGHQNWCKFDCGEEDIDWEVRAIPGKGMGLVAKRFIPSKYKIIIEGIHYSAKSHPGIAQLSPVKGTLRQKFENNELGGDARNHNGNNYVALRIARVNHSCVPNAAHIYCDTTKCEILYACRDIQEGEEICISYRFLTNIERPSEYVGLTVEEEFKSIKQTIKVSWGFVCPENCACNSGSLVDRVSKARELYAEFRQLGRSDPITALRLIDQLLTVMNSLNASWVAKANVHYEAYKLAIRHPNLVRLAAQHIENVCKIYAVVSPLSKDTQTYRSKLSATLALLGSAHS